MAKAMLPKQIDPIQLAEHKTALKGELCLSDMVRLNEILLDKKGIARIDLNFGKDAADIAYVRGSIKTEFKLSCQRCSGPMSLALEIAVALSPVRTDEEAQQLPKEYDPLILTDDTLQLITLVEEEILLSVPIVPKHSVTECPSQSSHIEWEEEKDTGNPFADLKKLLRE
jgi:uncharacterized protein